tara:strand:+ start:88 stop:759 length:672 start_codon:yes stop_codon:yes gene_type:complete
MHWVDEGYLLSKNNFNENSIIIEAFTLKHGKYTGIVYGGSSRKQKRNFQIGNKILLNWMSKSENRHGYFSTELIKPISPLFFDDKERSVCLLSATSILKILLPERQINTLIYNSFENMIDDLKLKSWIKSYIYWELYLIKQLGFETNFLNEKNKNVNKENFIKINGKSLKIPNLFNQDDLKKNVNSDIKEALIFNKNLLLENFILPNKLKFPLFRNILEKYYN